MPTKTKSKVKAPQAKSSSTKKSGKGLSAKSRQLVDEVLIKVSPQVQKHVDHLIETLQNTKEARLGDLKWMAGQILLRSKEISAQLKAVREKPAAAKAASGPKKNSKLKVSKANSGKPKLGKAGAGKATNAKTKTSKKGSR